MANYAEFKPDVWSVALLANFYKNLTARSLANVDYEGDFLNGAKTVNIITPAAGSVSTYSGSVTWSEIDSATTPLTLNAQDYVAFKVSDVDQAQSNFKILDALVAPSGQALAAKVDKSIYALAGSAITGGAGDINIDASNLSSVAAGDVFDKLLEAGENLDKKDAPRDGRFVVASPRFLRMAMLDGDFISARELGDTVATEGTAGRIAGFDVIPSNNVHVAKVSTKDTDHLFYGVRGSFAAAVRLDGEPEGMRLESDFAYGIRMLALYGSKIIRPAGLGRLLVKTEA